MMKRKVNRVGQNTLTVSLPSKWAKEHGLNAGDDIELLENGNTLTISKSKIAKKEEITIEIKNAEHFFKRLLVLPYIKGYGVMKIKYNDPKVYFLVQKTVNDYLLGFEIVDYNKDGCIIRNLAESLEGEFDSTFRRFFLQVKSILESLKTAIENKNENELENIIILDIALDKFHLFLRRMINTKGTDTPTKNYYNVNMLENVSDYTRNIVRKIQKSKKYPSKDFVEVLKKVLKLGDLYYDLYYNFDNTKLKAFKHLVEEIDSVGISHMNTKKGEENYCLSQLLAITNMFHCLSEELGE